MIETFGIIIFISIFLYFIWVEIQDKKLLETVTKSHRGNRSERALVLKLLKSGIPPQTIFHDLYLKINSGKYSQIDLVVPTKVGIIVFEVKDYKGWIFGTGYKKYWTQVLAYGKIKHRFYNPILQNNKHVEDLKKQLHQENVPFYSVVVFFGNCVFKDIDFISDGTFLVKSNRVLEVIKTIKNQNEPAYYKDKREVVRILGDAVKNGNNSDIQRKHIENIEDMLAKTRIYN